MATATKVNNVIKLGPAVGAYAQGLFQASAVNEGDEPKYGITLLFPKATAGKTLATLRKMIDEQARIKFGPKYTSLPKFHMPIRDGDVEKPEKKEFAGMFFVRCSSKNRPGLVNRHLQPVTDKEEAFSGCKFVVSAAVYAFDHKVGGKGVSLFLNNAMVFEKGERIDGRVDAAEDFKEFAGDEEPAEQAAESALD